MAGGRPPGFTMSNEHRAKLQKSNILNCLVEHVEGKREMSSTQVTAGIALLRKFMPDLQAVQLSGDPDNPIEHRHKFTDAERFAALQVFLAKVEGLVDRRQAVSDSSARQSHIARDLGCPVLPVHEGVAGAT